MDTIAIISEEIMNYTYLSDYIESGGYNVVLTGPLGIEGILGLKPKLFLIDRKIASIYLLESCLNKYPDIKIVIFGDVNMDIQVKSDWYSAGMDEYLAFPVTKYELLAHIQAILRRGRACTMSRIINHGVILDATINRLNYGLQRVSLSDTEQKMLSLLFIAEDYVSKDEIMDNVWGDKELFPNIIDAYILKLRKKLFIVQAPLQIVTIRNKGYQLIFIG